MNETLSLDQLAERANQSHPNSNIAIAMIADYDLTELEKASNKVKLDNVVDEVEAETANDFAQRAYDTNLKKSGLGEVPESLQIAASKSLEAEERLKEARSKTELASKINKMQKHLSKPMRLAATLLTALTIGGGSTGALLLTEPDWSSYHSAKSRLNAKEAKNNYTQTTIVLGAAMTLFGGMAGSVGGSRLAGREARRRARRIVAREDLAA